MRREEGKVKGTAEREYTLLSVCSNRENGEGNFHQLNVKYLDEEGFLHVKSSAEKKMNHMIN